MRRHEVSVFSLAGGVIFGAAAILLLVTDGRFSDAGAPFAAVALVTAGLVGLALVASAVRAIIREQRSANGDGTPAA